MIAPNKEEIYPENLPITIRKNSIEPLISILRKNGINVVYPKKELLRAKKEISYPLYYPSDLHWNESGAM